jgi:hypothetical protein
MKTAIVAMLLGVTGLITTSPANAQVIERPAMIPFVRPNMGMPFHDHSKPTISTPARASNLDAHQDPPPGPTVIRSQTVITSRYGTSIINGTTTYYRR